MQVDGLQLADAAIEEGDSKGGIGLLGSASGPTATAELADNSKQWVTAAVAASAGCSIDGTAPHQQPQQQPQQREQQQQAQQQQPAGKTRASYVPRFTKRKQNYNMLVDSMQQQQDGTAAVLAAALAAATAGDGFAAAAAAAAAAGAVEGAEGDSDLCMIEDSDAGSDGDLIQTRTAAAAAGKVSGVAVPLLSRRWLSTSVAAAAAAAGQTDTEALDAEGAAALPGQSQGVDAAGITGKRPVLPLLRRRGGAAGAFSQQQEQGLQDAAVAAAAAAAGNCSGGEAIEDGSSDDGDDRQQQQQIALEGTGYRGAVPTLGRWVMGVTDCCCHCCRGQQYACCVVND
jgi:hypothetical protein